MRINRISRILLAVLMAITTVCLGFTAILSLASGNVPTNRLIYSQDFEDVENLKTDTPLYDFDWNLNGEHSNVISPSSKWENYTSPLSGLKSYRFVSNNNQHEQRDNYVEFMDMSPNEIALTPNRDYVMSFKMRTNNLKQLKVSFLNLGYGDRYNFAFNPITNQPTAENRQQTGEYYITPYQVTGDGQAMCVVYLTFKAKIIPSFGGVALFSGKKINAGNDCCFDIDDFKIYEGKLNAEREYSFAQSNNGSQINYNFETTQQLNTEKLVIDGRDSVVEYAENIEGFNSKVLKVSEPANSNERALFNLNDSKFSLKQGMRYRVSYKYKTENIEKIKIEAFTFTGGGKAIMYLQETKEITQNDWSTSGLMLEMIDLGDGVTQISYEMERFENWGNPFLMVVFPKDRSQAANVYIDDFSVCEVVEKNIPQENQARRIEDFEGKNLNNIKDVKLNSPISVWQPGGTTVGANTTVDADKVISGSSSLLIEINGSNGDIPLFDITPSPESGYRPGLVPKREYTFSFKYRVENVNLIKFEFDKNLIDSGNLEYLPQDITKQTANGSFDNENWQCRDLGDGVFELAFSFVSQSTRVARPFLFCMQRTSDVTSRLVIDDIQFTVGDIADFNQLTSNAVSESEDFETLYGKNGLGDFNAIISDGSPLVEVIYDNRVINGSYSVAVKGKQEVLNYTKELREGEVYTIKLKYSGDSPSFKFMLRTLSDDILLATFDNNGVVSGGEVSTSNIKKDGYVNAALTLNELSTDGKLYIVNDGGEFIFDDFKLMTNATNVLDENILKIQVESCPDIFIESTFDNTDQTNKFLINRLINFPFLPDNAIADVSQTYKQGETINGDSSIKISMTNDKAGLEAYPLTLRVNSGGGSKSMVTDTIYTAKFRYRVLSDEKCSVTDNSRFFAFAKWDLDLTPYNMLAFTQDGKLDTSTVGFAGYDNVASAKITEEVEGVFNVVMTFRTQPLSPYGMAQFGFGMMGSGVLIVDDFQLYQGHNDDSLPRAGASELPQSTLLSADNFENGLGNYYAWQDAMLQDESASVLTTNPKQVINGSASLHVNRDIRNESGANTWSGFLRSKEGKHNLNGDTYYTVQMRYKILSDVTGGGWFYVMLKANTDKAGDMYLGFDANGVNFEYLKGVAYYDIVDEGDTSVLTVSMKTSTLAAGMAYSGLEMGSYRGGEMMVDDVMIYEGCHIKAMPTAQKLQIGSSKVIETYDFNSSNGYSTHGQLVDNGISGSSLKLASTATREDMLNFNTSLSANTRYSVFFRYKPMDIAEFDGNGNFLLGIKTNTVASDYKFYQSFSKDGKVLNYNYDGSFSGYQIYDMAINKSGDHYDVSFNFVTGNSFEYKLYFGIYGAGAMLVDDITINEGITPSISNSGDSIVEIIAPTKINVNLGDKITLPNTVDVKLNDGSIVKVNVAWENIQNISTAGNYSIKGVIDFDSYHWYAALSDRVTISLTVENVVTPPSDGTMPTYAIVLIVIGGAIVLAGLAALICIKVKKSKLK